MSEYVEVHRGVVLGNSEHFPEDRHVARALADSEPGAWWTRDADHARERYTGGPGQVGAVLHARVRAEDAQEHRGEIFLRPGVQAEVHGHTVVRRPGKTAAGDGSLGDLTYKDDHRHMTGPGHVTYHVEVEHGRRRPDAVAPEQGPVTPAYLQPADKSYVQIAVEPHGKTLDEMDQEAHKNAYDMASATSPHDMVTKTRILHVEAGRKTASDWHQFDTNRHYRAGHQDGANAYMDDHEHLSAKADMGIPLEPHEIDYMVGHAHGTERAREHAQAQHDIKRIWEEHGKTYGTRKTGCWACGHEMFPVDQLHHYDTPSEDPEHPSYRGDDGHSLESLREEVKRDGAITEPLEIGRSAHEVEHNNDHSIYVFNGNHRLQVARELGHTHVPVSQSHADDALDYKPHEGKTAHVLTDWQPTERIFAPTKGGVDPRLFDTSRQMLPEVRSTILAMAEHFLRQYGPEWQSWARVYLAGSEASEWYGNNDFDILVGIEYDTYRNVTGSRLSDQEITKTFNAGFKVMWNDESWHPPFAPDEEWHLTGYVNPNSWDIRRIKPYAAYEVVSGQWFVEPPSEPEGHRFADSEWYLAEGYAEQVRAYDELPEPHRTEQLRRLWQFLHKDRGRAFGPNGTGVFDRGNVVEKYLDQAGLWDVLVRAQYGTKTAMTEEDHEAWEAEHGSMEGYTPQSWHDLVHETHSLQRIVEDGNEEREWAGGRGEEEHARANGYQRSKISDFYRHMKERTAARPGFAPCSDDLHPAVTPYQSGGIGHLPGDEHRSVVAMVPTHVMEQYRAHDGRQQPGSGERDRKIIDGIRHDIREGRGINDPIMLEHDPDEHWGAIGEGNHRLAAAREEGISHVPVRVVSRTRKLRGRTLGSHEDSPGRNPHGGAPLHLTTDFAQGDYPYTPPDIHPHHFAELAPESKTARMAALSRAWETQAILSKEGGYYAQDDSAAEGTEGAQALAGKGKPRAAPARRQGDEGAQRGGSGAGEPRGAQQAVGPVGRGFGTGNTSGTYTVHPKVDKDMKSLDKPVRARAASIILALSGGEKHSSTHPLPKTLPGWHSTHVNSGTLIIHQTNEDGTLHVGGVFPQHAYDQAERRLGYRAQEVYA